MYEHTRTAIVENLGTAFLLRINFNVYSGKINSILGDVKILTLFPVKKMISEVLLGCLLVTLRKEANILLKFSRLSL